MIALTAKWFSLSFHGWKESVHEYMYIFVTVKPPAPAPVAAHLPDVAVKVDTKAVAALKAELEDLRASTVSKESYEQLRRELNDTKKALDVFKTDTLEKFRSLMREVGVVVIAIVSAYTQICISQLCDIPGI